LREISKTFHTPLIQQPFIPRTFVDSDLLSHGI
jgi:hypothetical protein